MNFWKNKEITNITPLNRRIFFALESYSVIDPTKILFFFITKPVNPLPYNLEGKKKLKKGEQNYGQMSIFSARCITFRIPSLTFNISFHMVQQHL